MADLTERAQPCELALDASSEHRFLACEVVVEAAGSRCESGCGLDLGDAQLMSRYQRWRSLDTFMVSLATDGLTRLYGVPGKTASAVRRFGMGLVNRIGPLKDRLTAEARGTSGDLPLLLRGLPI